MNSFNPFDDLIDFLRDDGTVAWEVSRPTDEQEGEWWLDLSFDKQYHTIMWKRSAGFGLFAKPASIGQRPDEYHANVILAYNRLTEILGIEE